MNSSAPTPRVSFWRRRVGGPVLALLAQGTTPDRLALTLAFGTAAALLPFLGFTSLFVLGVGLVFRLNQPLLQMVNWLLGPLQIALILVYVRMGEKIWGAEPMPISVGLIVRQFKADPGAFMKRFGWTGVHAATAWALSVPPIVAAVYFLVRPLLRRLAAAKPRG